MAKKKASSQDIIDRLTTEVPRTSPIPDSDWLSSGITILNLAATGHLDHFIPKGKYVYYVGDSSSGKTHYGFNLLASAANNPAFKKHRLVFDNAERGALFDVESWYGSALADRLQPPAGTKDNPTYSSTVQEFFFHIDAVLDRGPCVYLLDSVDAIGADADEEHFETERAAYEKGKTSGGSFGLQKAKYISQHIGRVNRRLNETGSILILISQTRDKIGGMIPGQKSRSGGRALKFFARLELWTSIRGTIKQKVLDKEREVGSYITVDIQKNHLSGWEGKVPTIAFYRTSGFDDTGTNVSFLVEEGVWHKAEKGGRITAEEFDFVGTQNDLIAHIESTGKQDALRGLVASRWAKIEAETARLTGRKPRFT